MSLVDAPDHDVNRVRRPGYVHDRGDDAQDPDDGQDDHERLPAGRRPGTACIHVVLLEMRSPGPYLGFLTNMNPPPASASTPTMNDAVARRSWFVAMNTIPTTQMTTPNAIRIKAVVRFDDCLLDPVAEVMLPPTWLTSAGSPGLNRRGSLLTDARYYVVPGPSSQVG